MKNMTWFWAEHKWLGGSLGEQGLLAGTGLHFGDCAAAPAGLNGGWEAGHSSQRQVAQCKQLILEMRLRSGCNHCRSWEDE